NLALWETDGTGINDNKNYEEFSKNPRSGKKAMAFWDDEPFSFTIEQTITTIKPGTYTAGGFIEGNGASSKDLQKLYVIVTDSNKKKTKYEATCSLNGWLNWENPEISNVKVSQGDTITVGMEIQSTVAGAWGSIDDMYLYGKYGLNLGDIKNGVVNVSNMEADSGEVVRIAAMPENGYYLSKLELTGETVTKDILKDESGLGKTSPEEADNKSVLTYNDTDNKSDETIQAYFVMPEGTVTLNAEFTQVPLTSVPMDKVVAKGFTPGDDGKYVYETDQEYTGKKIELDLELSYGGYKLTSADYTAKYKNNVNKTTGDNMAEITVTAKGKKFTGKKTLYFNIEDTKVDISKAKAVLTDDDPNKVDTYYYTGAEIEPVITSLTDKSGQPLKNKDGSGNLIVSADDYKIYYQKNIKIGKAAMTVIANSGSSKIKGSFTQTFTIAKRPIVDNSGNLANGITIVAPTGSTYTGSKITPNVTVKYGNKELQKGRDYTVTYKNNVNVSTSVTDNKKKPSIKITGKGNYTGVTKEYYFEISAKSISDYGMKAEAEAIAENKAPKITLKNGTKKLTLNKHYRITEILRKANGDKAEEIIYKCDTVTGNVTKGTKPNAAIKDVGEYTVTLSGIEKGGYTGTQTVDFRVIDKEHLISTAKVTKIPKSMPYTGSEVELKEKDIEVKNSKGGTLTYGVDYTLSYNDVNGNKTNIKAGKVTVTITGKGDYAGTKTAKFTIVKRVVEAGKADGTAANKDKAAITYEVKADTLLDKIAKKTAAGSALELPYTGFAWTPELDVYATNAGVKKLLTKGTDYTISYKNNLKPGSEASITIKGKGNYSGSVKFDKVFTVKDVTLDDFVITINPVEYNGKALKPAINFVYKETGTVVNMKTGTAYAVKYKNNKNVASIESATKPTVTITEKGLNAKKKGIDKDKVDLAFTITTARITAASVSDVKIQTYNGKPSKPALTIKVNGKKLKAGTDYVVTYSGNTRPNDKATARIIGIGNYSGTVNKTFVIK
ncbi:MAG: hypothetical protein HDR29_02765, partial [Lachnospiraceae bacterium]|nr:hypothetical protein [Lachnospiraceae bacterium]